MSRALAKEDRVPLDAYMTDDDVALALAWRVAATYRPALIVEPSAGCGAFVRAARAAWAHVPIWAVEIDKNVPAGALLDSGASSVYYEDWVSWARSSPRVLSRPAGPVLIIGNPPFSLHEAHVRAALQWMEPGDQLAFLLRLNALGSHERVSLWANSPLVDVATIVPRPSFNGGAGTDGTEYALFRWIKGYEGPRLLTPPIVWREDRRKQHRIPSRVG